MGHGEDKPRVQPQIAVLAQPHQIFMARCQAPEGAATVVRHSPAVENGLAFVLDVRLVRGAHSRPLQSIVLFLFCRAAAIKYSASSYEY